jgi:Flp pilus assembly protein TadD/2-polyprenyl-3-methyl-5-hydroxy-6-metoxy-1,4-benzoquinol methylase
VAPGDIRNMLEEAVRRHQAGQIEQAALLYRKVLAADPDNANALHLLGMVALQQGQPQTAIDLIGRALAVDDRQASYHFHHALALQNLDDMEGAVAGYRRALALKPDDPDTYNNMGNALAALGKREEALAAFRRLLALQPGNAIAHNNLGNVQRDLGLAAEAEASFRKALSLDPNLAGALVNLGHARWESGALAEAETLYRRAAAGQPGNPDLLDNLAALRLARGDSDGALEMIRRSLALAETAKAKKLFVQAASRADLLDEGLRGLVARALAEPWDRPALLAPAAARLLRSQSGEKSGESGFGPLADDTLLQALLTSTPNMDIALERRLTGLRGTLLREHAGITDNGAERFAALLAQQCFINEYVFPADDAEEAAATALRRTVEMAANVTPLQLLLAACYFPLHGLANAAGLLERSWPAHVEAVLSQQIREPLAERRLRAQIPRLTRIEDAVSRRVQAQYEENPYPRWVRPAPEAPDTIEHFLAAKFAPFTPPPRALQDMLIAGCGTGQRAIAMAGKFGDGDILALDLSLASLAYAKRKADELGLKIAYGQADILNLEEDRQFDLIESLGVLHHMADPFAGWRKLLSLLRPGGVMLIGLYSESARRPIRQVRAQIAERALGPGAIRSFRQALIDSGSAHASILQSEDFFSLSACRDLLFHVQEQQLRLPAIAGFLAEQELQFLGFELNAAVLAAYRQRFPQDRSATDLALWDSFEAEHPGLFGGMYTFWIQKVIQKPGTASAAEY